MDLSALIALLMWAAQAIGVPTPPLPRVYSGVPEQQICAMVKMEPCNPNIRLREDRTVWLGVASHSGDWIAINENLMEGSLYWRMIAVHEFTHIARARNERLCDRVDEYQARLVAKAWLHTQGTTLATVTGWNLPPFEAASIEETRVCGLPRLHIEREREGEER